MIMKSYTDLPQSKKLAEFLPIESADMFWLVLGNTPRVHVLTEPLSNYSQWESYPCWSLAVLLSVLPKNLHTVLAIGELEKYAIGSTDTNKYDCIADNPVDACVAMIEKLHEQNIL